MTDRSEQYRRWARTLPEAEVQRIIRQLGRAVEVARTMVPPYRPSPSMEPEPTHIYVDEDVRHIVSPSRRSS